MVEAKTPEEVWTDRKARARNITKPEKVPSKDDVLELRKILDEIEIARMDARPIADFFEAVGTGVVEAQRKLDRRSDIYNEQSPELPTLFRIPSVKAEIQFGITSVNSTGFNILIAQSKDEIQQRMQQTVSFEIVAVPPPPNPKQKALSAEVIPGTLVLNVSRRRAVIREIIDKLGTASDKPWLKEIANQVLIWQVSPSHYFAVAIYEGSNTVSGMYLFGLKDDGFYESYLQSESAKSIGMILRELVQLQASALPPFDEV